MFFIHFRIIIWAIKFRNMRNPRIQRWNILQRMVFVVRNFKSIVLTAVSNKRYPARSITSNSVSDFEVTFEEEGNRYHVCNEFRNNTVPNNVNKQATTPIDNREKIGDIVGISSR